MKFAANLNLKEHQFFFTHPVYGGEFRQRYGKKANSAIGRAIAETLNAGGVNKSLKSSQM